MQPPNNFANYPRYSPGQGSGRPPGVYFETISEAFNMIKADLVTWVATSLLFIVCCALAYGVNFAIFGPQTTLGQSEDPIKMLKEFLPQYILGIVTGSFFYGVYIGLYSGIAVMGIKQANGESIKATDLFLGFKNPVSVLVVGFLVSLMTQFGYCCCILPGVYLTGATALATLIASQQGLGPIDAIGDSMKVLKPFAFPMFGLVLVAGIVSGLGALLLGVGLVITLPIYGIVLGLTYRTFYNNPNPNPTWTSVPPYQI